MKRKALLDDVIRALLQHHIKTILLSETANVSANKHSTSTFYGSFSFKKPTCSREHGFSSKKIYIASNGVPHMGNLALTMSVCKPKPGGFP